MPIQTVRAAGGGAEARHLLTRIARARAPLRIGLAGGGTDVSPFCDLYGGLVLNATIDKYCYATVEALELGRVQFCSADQQLVCDLETGGDILPLHVAVYRRMCSEFALGSPSLKMTTASDAPPGSGLGSSSTLVVALVEACREYFDLPLGEYDVARLAYDIERNDCGFQGGRQDQYAATFGGFNSIEFFAGERVVVNPLRIKEAVVTELEASTILYYTGAVRDSGRIIAAQSEAVAANEHDRIEATLMLKEEANAMKVALLRGDLQEAAEILARGWQAKRRLADGIETPTITNAFSVARANGAVAGKVSGAGGGGYVLFLTDPLARANVLSALSALPGGRVESIHFTNAGATSWRVQ